MADDNPEFSLKLDERAERLERVRHLAERLFVGQMTTHVSCVSDANVEFIAGSCLQWAEEFDECAEEWRKGQP